MTPLKELLTYLDTNIYSKMDKKDVEQIKKKSLAGGLMDAINKYCNQYHSKTIERKDETIKIQLENLTKKDDRIKELEGKYEPHVKTLAEEMGYGLGKYCGD